MLPETSIARTIVSWRVGSVIVPSGRAEATIISAIATRISAGGTWRRQPGPRASASRTSDRLA